LRWHLIETAPGVYDWSSWLPMVRAAREAGVTVIWDMYHYGSPDYLDQKAPEFIEAYARFAAEAVRLHREETGQPMLVCPVNEISFVTWAVENDYFPPKCERGGGFKRQLVRAGIAGIHAMRAVDAGCRFVWAEPLIHVAPHDHTQKEVEGAERMRVSQYEAYDMLMGLVEPELGGSPDMVDMVGLNFYPHNQWYFLGGTIPMGHHEYRPLADMLAEVAERYNKPILIAETGAEGSCRPSWFHYVCAEVREAMARGCDINGVCFYPVTAYPGWDNARHCEVGLFSPVLADGERKLFRSLADELERQRAMFEAVPAKGVKEAA
jgi:beta-glucosidase/6-phospho-beta-glucosidase/beta-galactosidase